MKEVMIKDLDVRKILPFERHTKIFEVWNNLKVGEFFRLTNDHDPRPLYYLFEVEHKGKFEWDYEQNGPKDWIVRIKKISRKDDKKEKIKSLIKQLRSKEDISNIKKEEKDILKSISPTDLALIEQEMIREGMSREEMKKLCDVHLEVMKDNLGKTKVNVKSGHPIHTLMEEHKAILNFIDKLQSIISKLKSASDFNKVVKEIKMLKHISEHLIEAEKHHQREEEVLFPVMEEYNITEPPEIMKEEHKELKKRKIMLDKIVNKNKKVTYSVFVRKVEEAGGYLIKELPSHIYKEDNILYPMALQVIKKERWLKIKEGCDKIGYCCFTPK